MNIVPAQEIKRRGIAAVDEALAKAGRATRHRSVDALLKHLDQSAE
jgi:hypothetical protein